MTVWSLCGVSRTPDADHLSANRALRRLRSAGQLVLISVGTSSLDATVRHAPPAGMVHIPAGSYVPLYTPPRKDRESVRGAAPASLRRGQQVDNWSRAKTAEYRSAGYKTVADGVLPELARARAILVST